MNWLRFSDISACRGGFDFQEYRKLSANKQNA
jgi:hypothetical protein